jgi:hypothetical protein
MMNTPLYLRMRRCNHGQAAVQGLVQVLRVPMLVQARLLALAGWSRVVVMPRLA